MTPPVAPKIPKTLTIHGETRNDPYYWLREKSAPETTAYLEAENAYTESVMAPVASLRDTIYNEILSRIQQTDLEVPVPKDDYFYYSRTEEGKQYPIFCRKYSTLEAPEQIILDANALAAGKEYFALGAFSISEDHNLLGYSIDENGSEQYTIQVKNLNTGEILPDRIPLTSAGFTWANDHRTFFYTTFDETLRPEKVFRHTIGQDPALDTLLFTETDPLFTFEVSKTRSHRYILITSVNASTTSEVLTLPADLPESTFTVFHPRVAGIEYYLEHHLNSTEDRFLIRTNEDAVNFKILSAPTAAPALANWKLFRPEHPEFTLDAVDAFEDFLVLQTREHGLPCLNIQSANTPETHAIEFPEASYTAGLGPNAQYNTQILRFEYTSQITPRSVFDYDMSARTRTLLKQTPVLGHFDPADYTTARVYATATDGTRIPISLVARKDATGPRPLLLNGYGSYGINYDPAFSYSLFSLLDRGFVAAIAHVRGGGELGRRWFESGRKLQKRNTFTDFIACAEHLVSTNYTAPHLLCAMGGSAGGLLMGAILNLRPDLFHSVVAQVPFVDVVTTMLDPTIPLTTGEYDQWGNPEEKTYYDYIRTYSPYDNVEPKAYPNLLVTTGLNDPRVAYWEPAKWVAKLRATKTDHNTLLLKTQMGAGHGGPSGRYEKYKETAFAYSFLLLTLGLENHQPSQT